MTLFDWLALGLIGLSTALSLMRGLVAEAGALVRWIVALLAARWLAQPFADVAFVSLQPRPLAVAAAFVLLFVAAMLLQYFVRALLTSALSAVGLGGVNRLLGAAFGFVRGVLLVTLAVLVCSFTDLPQTAAWRQAQTAWIFEQLAQLALPYLPPVVSRYGSL